MRRVWGFWGGWRGCGANSFRDFPKSTVFWRVFRNGVDGELWGQGCQNRVLRGRLRGLVLKSRKIIIGFSRCAWGVECLTEEVVYGDRKS